MKAAFQPHASAITGTSSGVATAPTLGAKFITPSANERSSPRNHVPTRFHRSRQVHRLEHAQRKTRREKAGNRRHQHMRHLRQRPAADAVWRSPPATPRDRRTIPRPASRRWWPAGRAELMCAYSLSLQLNWASSSGLSSASACAVHVVKHRRAEHQRQRHPACAVCSRIGRGEGSAGPCGYRRH